MRTTIALLAIAFAAPAAAQTTAHKPPEKPAPAAAKPAPAANAPKELGKFDDWTAAIHQECGQTVCYAFVRAHNSAPSLAGRGDVVLTVTERPTGRDAVAISAGFAFAPGAEVLGPDRPAGLHFYTAQRNAFARDGARPWRR